jgi:copper chaperone CopZ
MNQLTLTIPAMYADHHVTKVRQTLLQLNGVEEVIASAAFKAIVVDFDPAKISSEQIEQTLARGGYAPGVPEVVERTPDYTADPAWEVLAPRLVTTNVVDLQMSGEFRKY